VIIWCPFSRNLTSWKSPLKTDSLELTAVFSTAVFSTIVSTPPRSVSSHPSADESCTLDVDSVHAHEQHHHWKQNTQNTKFHPGLPLTHEHPAPVVPTVTPYRTPYFSNRGSRGASTSTGHYPLASPLRSSSGGMSRVLPGNASSFHELPNYGAVNWMSVSKGPYLGGVQKTFKTLSISLFSDGFDDFFRFYNGLITQLSLAGYHRRLLPSLELIASDVDLCQSPVNAACMPISDEHCLAEWSQSAYWDEQHDHLSQLLYLTLTSKDVIKSTAPVTLGIVNRHSQYSNGFGVLQALIRRHHPRVLLSSAPNFEQCLFLRPTLQVATGSHPAYLSLFERWMDRMRLYHEFGVIHKPSQFSIWFIRGLSLPLRAQLKDQELILLRFQAHHRATTEPDLLPETEVAELGQLLDVFAPETSPIEALTKGSTVTAAAIHAVAAAIL
jgi:hypothetical protein